MFNLNPSPTFKAPVPLSVPGVSQPLEVVFTFKHKTRTAIEKWAQDYLANPGAEVLDQVIAGWDLKRDGEPVPYSFSALSDLIEMYTPARSEISDAYITEITRAKRKN
ncbi:phage tail assembly chaperone [Hydrogenophaga sp.]|uniref:phage tail assembly chaperone n=1 Tax=Hydrogenophaga sp. TaxID=1904254 RepID=UPI00272F02BD|nr:phage tail assembly chaperone [Hydrogenophaga sp.]MDP1686884.1 phage tail assembly chaperone [Hydrogenophaga sp.]